jgi:hypothetical protein
MDTMIKPEADRVYEDFEPYYEWDKNDRRFIVMLPGKCYFMFSKEKSWNPKT